MGYSTFTASDLSGSGKLSRWLVSLRPNASPQQPQPTAKQHSVSVALSSSVLELSLITSACLSSGDSMCLVSCDALGSEELGLKEQSRLFNAFKPHTLFLQASLLPLFLSFFQSGLLGHSIRNVIVLSSSRDGHRDESKQQGRREKERAWNRAVFEEGKLQIVPWEELMELVDEEFGEEQGDEREGQLKQIELRAFSPMDGKIHSFALKENTSQSRGDRRAVLIDTLIGHPLNHLFPVFSNLSPSTVFYSVTLSREPVSLLSDLSSIFSSALASCETSQGSIQVFLSNYAYNTLAGLESQQCELQKTEQQGRVEIAVVSSFNLFPFDRVITQTKQMRLAIDNSVFDVLVSIPYSHKVYGPSSLQGTTNAGDDEDASEDDVVDEEVNGEASKDQMKDCLLFSVRARCTVMPLDEFGFTLSTVSHQKESGKGWLDAKLKYFGEICIDVDSETHGGNGWYHTGCCGILASRDGTIQLAPVSAVDVVVIEEAVRGRQVVVYPILLERRIKELLNVLVDEVHIVRGVNHLTALIVPHQLDKESVAMVKKLLQPTLARLDIGVAARLDYALVEKLPADTRMRKWAARYHVAKRKGGKYISQEIIAGVINSLEFRSIADAPPIKFLSPIRAMDLNTRISSPSNGRLHTHGSALPRVSPISSPVSQQKPQSVAIEQDLGNRKEVPLAHVKLHGFTDPNKCKNGVQQGTQGNGCMVRDMMQDRLSTDAQILELKSQLEQAMRVLASVTEQRDAYARQVQSLRIECGQHREERMRRERLIEKQQVALNHAHSRLQHLQDVRVREREALASQNNHTTNNSQRRLFQPRPGDVETMCQLLCASEIEMAELQRTSKSYKAELEKQLLQVDVLRRRVEELESTCEDLKLENDTAVDFMLRLQPQENVSIEASGSEDRENVQLNHRTPSRMSTKKKSTSSPGYVVTPIQKSKDMGNSGGGKRKLVPLSASKLKPMQLEDFLADEPDLVDTDAGRVEEHVGYLEAAFESRGIAFPLHKDKGNQYVMEIEGGETQVLTLGVFCGRLVVEKPSRVPKLMLSQQGGVEEEDEGEEADLNELLSPDELAADLAGSSVGAKFTDLLHFLVCQ